jgi:hypothetical protein
MDIGFLSFVMSLLVGIWYLGSDLMGICGVLCMVACGGDYRRIRVEQDRREDFGRALEQSTVSSTLHTTCQRLNLKKTLPCHHQHPHHRAIFTSAFFCFLLFSRGIGLV